MRCGVNGGLIKGQGSVGANGKSTQTEEAAGPRRPSWLSFVLKLGDAPGTSTLTGPVARTAARPYGRWLLITLLASVVAGVIGWLVSHRSIEQLIYLAFGIQMLGLAIFVWRYRLIGVGYSEEGEKDTLRLVASPLPRWIVAPMLAIVALVLILSATSSGVGSVLMSVVRGGFTVFMFGKVAVPLLIDVALFVGAIAMLSSREARAGGLFLLGVFAFLGLWIFILYRFAPGYPKLFDEEVFRPLREMWKLLGGR